MSDGTTTTAAPAPADTTTAAAPAAPAPAPAAFESLIHEATDTTAAAPAAAPAPAAAAEDPFAAILGKVPEKFHVKDGDKLDTAASVAKALEHREHLEKRLGAGDLPPKNAAEYGFTPPDQFKDLEFNAETMTAFKEGAHKLGFTQAQYEFAMKMHLESVPSLMEGAAKMTAAQAREELGKVWTTPAAMEAGIGDATRALKSLPPPLQEATRAFGTDPAFLQAMAYYGAQMREDRTPNNAAPPSPAGDVTSLMASEAYVNPKHPQHAAVSRQVQEHFARVHGAGPL